MQHRLSDLGQLRLQPHLAPLCSLNTHLRTYRAHLCLCKCCSRFLGRHPSEFPLSPSPSHRINELRSPFTTQLRRSLPRKPPQNSLALCQRKLQLSQVTLQSFWAAWGSFAEQTQLPNCYGLNVHVPTRPHKFIGLSPNCQHGGIWRWETLRDN